MKQMLDNVSTYAGKNEEYNHKFFLRVKDMIDAEDRDMIHKERIPIKLLQLNPACQDGFIMTDFPQDLAEAEQLEEFRGGLNAYVHMNLPVETLLKIEAVRSRCENCGRSYYTEDVVDEEHGVHIERFMPKDGVCDDCGHQHFTEPRQTDEEAQLFQYQIEKYNQAQEELLAFYNTFGNLVNFEPRRGYQDYEKLKQQIQFNMKH